MNIKMSFSPHLQGPVGTVIPISMKLKVLWLNSHPQMVFLSSLHQVVFSQKIQEKW